LSKPFVTVDGERVVNLVVRDGPAGNVRIDPDPSVL
jgi:hypothetical protein